MADGAVFYESTETSGASGEARCKESGIDSGGSDLHRDRSRALREPFDRTSENSGFAVQRPLPRRRARPNNVGLEIADNVWRTPRAIRAGAGDCAANEVSMNVLLLSMPDSFEHMPPVAIRMPNGALASLAGNIDAHHRVAIADLILARTTVGATVCQLLAEVQPDVVGLSVMTFQRPTALRIAQLTRSLCPSTFIVAGGYDPSLAPEVYEARPDVDCVVRGEGEQTFSELLRARE